MNKPSNPFGMPLSASDSDAVSNWTLQNLESLGQVGQACAQGCLKWQQEIARFISERFSADMRAQQALMASRNPMDMLRIQQDWLEGATSAYAAEVKRLSEIATDISSGTMDSIRQNAAPVPTPRPPLKSVL
jgi:hypothetical protein